MLRKKIVSRAARIAVVGLGYVGLPLAVEFAKKGFSAIGIDVDKERVEKIRQRVSYITDVSPADLTKVIKLKKFSAESSFQRLAQADVVLVCVPTPLKRKASPDISFILEAVKEVRKYLHPGQLIVLESTTYPGTTEEEILPLLEASGLSCGKDFFLAFSPERIDPGNTRYPLRKIPKVVGGLTREATELTELLYKNIVKRVVSVSSPRVAETVKLLENTFRIVNIGLIDEIAQMCHKMNIDIWEVIDAAKSKPFGFMGFYPGPGVGGHCLDKNETVFIREENSLKALQMPEFINYIQMNTKRDIEMLTFDPIKRKSFFKKVLTSSVRPYRGQMINIATEDGRLLKVTDLHPMFIFNNGTWRLKYAKDLQRGDSLPICLGLPDFHAISNQNFVDIIQELKNKNSSLINKIRIKPISFRWSKYADQIKTIFRSGPGSKIADCCWDYLSDNYLPLKYFFLLENQLPIDHRGLKLITGRGPGYAEIPAVIELNEKFCRLIGYYLSEGCITKDKSMRVRFSFNQSEIEYINDVLAILGSWGIRALVYKSTRWMSSCIKVSSDILGFLIGTILNCGENCYAMQIPDTIFSLNQANKKAFISGLFRGGGCVEHFFGKWRYRKNEKEYFHSVNTANISFFTSSRRLFQQLIVLLNDLGIVATFKKRKYSLSIFGYEQLSFFKSLFEGKKKLILDRYLELNKNRPVNKTFKKFDNFATVKVKSINAGSSDWVYSVETEKPHSFVTSYGIVVHNCIPKDPLYLYWKAKKFGFCSRFIKLSSEIIAKMPYYVIGRLEDILQKKGLRPKGLKILVVGVTYKKDVRDLRKSPALDIIEGLRQKDISVSYHDPLIPYLNINNIHLDSIKPTAGILKRFDCTVIVTDHSVVDYDFLLKNSRLIFDTRNVYKGVMDKKIIRL